MALAMISLTGLKHYLLIVCKTRIKTGAWKGDTIFAYLSNIALEINFCNEKEQSKYKRS